MADAQRLILNPSASCGRSRDRLAPLLAEGRWDLRETSTPAETEAEARLAVRDGLPRLLVAGGDGTLHHVLPALVDTDCALGIVPLGSGNDLARALGLPLSPIEAGRLALRGSIRRIDVGRAGDRLFAGVLGFGFDGDVCDFLDRRRGLPLGRFAYPWAVLRTLGTFRPPSVRVDCDEAQHDGPVTLLGLANSPLFGGGMRIAPDARIDDGWLDLIVIGPVSRLTLLTVLPRVYDGRHLGHPSVRHGRVRHATLHARGDRWLYADGERLRPIDPDGTRVDLLPAALKVVA